MPECRREFSITALATLPTGRAAAARMTRTARLNCSRSQNTITVTASTAPRHPQASQPTTTAASAIAHPASALKRTPGSSLAAWTIATMESLKAWVINLDRAPERLARISAQLQRLGLPWERLQAVDARALTPAQQAQLDGVGYRRRHGMEPIPGELGCYLSHVEAMRRFLASEASFALILEDDVLLRDSLPAVLRGLTDHADRWDMVKLSAVHSGTPQPYLEVAEGHQLAVMLTKCTGSSAYVLNRHAAQAYLAGLLPMQLPFDHVFDQGWRFGLKVRLVTPVPCGHDEQIASTIGAPSSKLRKFHWTRRIRTHLWRLGNEWRR
jgi:glycosyl transferase family 25